MELNAYLILHLVELRVKDPRFTHSIFCTRLINYCCHSLTEVIYLKKNFNTLTLCLFAFFKVLKLNDSLDFRDDDDKMTTKYAT